MIDKSPGLLSKILNQVVHSFKKQVLTPHPLKVFSITDSIKAFRYMEQAKQIGKIVITIPKEKETEFDPKGTYLITGGLGALGLTVAKWLTEQGVKKLVLASRHIPTPSQEKILAQLKQSDCEIDVAMMDVSNLNQVKGVIQHIHTLKGVFHLAGVLEDTLLTHQKWEPFATTFLAKVYGAWNLHIATIDFPLHHFVLFSSVSSVFGSPGQSNYSSANAYLNGLAKYRIDSGLNALSINWGPWGNGGMAAHYETQLRGAGLIPLKPEKAIRALERALFRERYIQTIVQIDWDRYLRQQPRTIPFFNRFKHPEEVIPPQFLQQLQRATERERQKIIDSIVRKYVAKVLSVPIDALSDRTGFFTMGMDSLMVVELRNYIQQDLGEAVLISQTAVFDYPSVEELSNYLQTLLTTEALTPLTAPVKPLTQEAEPIAVVGMSCRFPGGANTPDDFWKMLIEGRDGMCEVPKERWDIDQYYDPDPNTITKMYVRKGGFLDIDVGQFDAPFFGITPTEAEFMDPQHRLLLEVVWEAIENAGLPPLELKGSATGVFIGFSSMDYTILQARHSIEEKNSPYIATGNTASTAAGRISFILGLKGPSLPIDTACSSSLVTLHYASKSLRSNEIDMAIVGGVNLMLVPETTIELCHAQMLAPDGYCKSFDAKANGYARGEGCGIVVLKRLSDAQKNNDTILSLIKGTAVNQDGASSGLTVPNGPSQEAVITEALQDARLTPNHIQALEAHGAGTSLGDPIEANSLGAIFHDNKQSLVMTSVKGNIGHLEAGAGVAGLIKMILSLQHEKIPPQAHFSSINTNIDLKQIPAVIPSEATTWKRTPASARRVGISSFSFSGTNAHAIIEEAPSKERSDIEVERSAHILPISAKSTPALKGLIKKYTDFFQKDKNLPVADICYTASVGRSHYRYRYAVVGETVGEIFSQLKKENEISENPQKGLRIIFEMTLDEKLAGKLGTQVYQSNSTYQKAFQAASQKGVPKAFTVQYALAQLWMSWGIYPQQIVAGGIGEIVALVVSGVISLNDAVNIFQTSPENAQKITFDTPSIPILSLTLDNEFNVSMNPIDYLTQVFTKASIYEKKLNYDPSEMVLSLGIETEGNRFPSLSAKHDDWITLLTTLKNLYIQGAEINWNSFDAPYQRRKVLLPNYPFQRKRYWVELVDTQAKLPTLQRVHPLLGAEFHSVLEGRIFENSLTIESVLNFSDISVYHHHLFPGSATIETIFAAGKIAYQTESCSLQNLEIHLPFAFKKAQTNRIQTVVHELENHLRVSLYQAEESEWIHTATGTVTPPKIPEQKDATWSQLKESCPQEIDAETIYKKLNKVNQYNSETFQVIEKCALGDFEAIAELNTSQETKNYSLHPSLFEGCLQVMYYLAKIHKPVITESVENIDLLHPIGSSVRIHVYHVTKTSEQIIKGDIDFIDADDVLIGRIQGYRGKMVEQESLSSELEYSGKVEEWFSEVIWKEKPLKQKERAPSGTWAVFSQNNKQKQAITKQLEKVQCRVVDGENIANVTGILFLLQVEHHVKPFGKKDQINLEMVMHTLQKLIKDEHVPMPKIFIVTYATIPFKSQLSGLNQTTILGMVYSVMREHPELSCRHIDLSPSFHMDHTIEILFNEIANLSKEERVCYRQRKRYVARIQPHKEKQKLPKTKLIDPKGSYIVTGGLGGLGLAVTQWLVERGAIHIILVSRHPPNELQLEKLKEISENKCEIKTVQLDVSHKQKVLRFIESCDNIKGIFHCAGVLDDGVFLSQTWERFNTVFSSKVYGAWNLHIATLDVPLDFFVLFSTVGAILGSAGQSNYTAANAYLDGLAWVRHDQKLPAQTVNWGPWAEVGMAAHLASRQASQGLIPFKVHSAIHALERAMKEGATQSIIVQFDWNRILRMRRTTSPLFNYIREYQKISEPLFLQRFKTSAKSERKKLLTNLVKRQVAKILSLPISEVTEELGFFNMGMDSLMAIELRNTLQEEIGNLATLSSTAIFDHQRVSLLVHYLDELLSTVPIEKGVPKIQQDEPIAVVTVSCAFPATIDTPEKFWELLSKGGHTITKVPQEKLQYYKSLGINNLDEGVLGGFVKPIEKIDETLYGVDSNDLDDRQKIVLDVTWKLFQRAGYSKQSLQDVNCGVFIGAASCDDITSLLAGKDQSTLKAISPSLLSINQLSNIVSYCFGLKGPSISVDTEGASSLVAIHHACQSLRADECTVAVAGGINLIFNLAINPKYSDLISPTGRCKTFDSSADGYVRSEGCGLVLLKKLDQSVEDGDQIIGVIDTSAVKQEGHTLSPMISDRSAQQSLLTDVLKRNQIASSDVQYYEANGLGTPLEDEIELEAIREVYGQKRDHENPIIIGAVKSNLGNMEGAAGVASLIKALLAIEHRSIPKNLFLKKINQKIPLKEIPLLLPEKLTPYPSYGKPLRAAVSSYGLTGTIANMIVREPPEVKKREYPSDRPVHIMTLSAPSKSELDELMKLNLAYFQEKFVGELSDIAYTANVGREHYAYRLAIAAKNQKELTRRLLQKEYTTGFAQKPPSIAFLINDKKGSYQGMGETLYKYNSDFQEAFDEGRALLKGSPLESYVIQYAFYYLWLKWGVTPNYLSADGNGKVLALLLAEVVTVDDAIKILDEKNRMENMKHIKVTTTKIPIVSAFTGRPIQPNRQSIIDWMFEKTLKTQHLNVDVVLSIGCKQYPETIPSLIKGEDEWQQIVSTLGELYVKGAPINWVNFDAPYHRMRCLLPYLLPNSGSL